MNLILPIDWSIQAYGGFDIKSRLNGFMNINSSCIMTTKMNSMEKLSVQVVLEIKQQKHLPVEYGIPRQGDNK